MRGLILFQPEGNSYPIADGYLFSVAYSRLESHKKVAPLFYHKLGFPRCLADVCGNWIHTPCASSPFKLFGEFFWHRNIHPPARAGKLLRGASKREVPFHSYLSKSSIETARAFAIFAIKNTEGFLITPVSILVSVVYFTPDFWAKSSCESPVLVRRFLMFSPMLISVAIVSLI